MKSDRWWQRFAPVQPFVPRSDLMNALLMAGQGVVGFGLGYELLHVGLSISTAAILGLGLAAAKAIGWVGWQREARRAQAL